MPSGDRPGRSHDHWPGRTNGCGRRDAERGGSGRTGLTDLEPFWPSRQPHLFDQTCPGSPGASRPSAR